jgi:hypothetical protein
VTDEVQRREKKSAAATRAVMKTTPAIGTSDDNMPCESERMAAVRSARNHRKHNALSRMKMNARPIVFW